MTTSLRDNPSPQSTLGLTADERFNYSKQQGVNGNALLAVVPAVVQCCVYARTYLAVFFYHSLHPLALLVACAEAGEYLHG